MAWRCGSISRSLFSAARTMPSRSSPLPVNRPPSSPLRAHLHHSRCPLTTAPRTMGQLGCIQSLLEASLTSHISVESRACLELSQGT